MALLLDADVQSELESMDGWVFDSNTIHKDISLDNYMAGINFVNQLAKVSEAHNHHPDLRVGWCKVGVTFTSHDQGGVTKKCISMAKAVESIINC